ncbi:hypothetical protein K469DRAFT_737351 [Zopfia rhizophila CBS 207.26]|uniref:RTA1 domain protein n=1 Tax=Zopfia rhizophila CBS 207.26 TaxID=1314779 RepID=A0A6A6E9G6_9PEZI|nr:hypothetical protein K469DRAFT_737351 [Zopfia rhizophila CBS 207.26]
MPDGKPGIVYFYAPNKIGPVIFAALFLISGLVHFWQCVHYKAFKITALHPFCCLLFAVGFALREYGAFDYDNLTVYIISIICIYCAPPILELANYHVLGRILYYVPYFAPFHPGRTLTTFGTLSFVVEILNALGVANLANPKLSQSRQDLGHILMKTALITQIGVITCFVVITAIFHNRCRKAAIHNKQVQGPLWTMYVSTALILIRTIYRTVEHFGLSRVPANPPPDWDPVSLSPIVRYEWFFYVFEAALMLENSIIWNVWHPRRYLPEDYHVYLAQDGKTELLGRGWKDDQNWIMTFFDPCGLTATIAGGGSGREKKERPFWETNGFENVQLVRGDEQEAV